MRLKFDCFVFDSCTQVIHGPDDQKLVMRPQATKVLECLLRHAPELVSKKDLLNEVWGHEALSESGVAQAIREIRKTLSDSASNPVIVGTRHGCGYCILCPVEPEPESSPSTSDAGAQNSELRHSRRPLYASGGRLGIWGMFTPRVLVAAILPVLVLYGLSTIYSWPRYMFDVEPGASLRYVAASDSGITGIPLSIDQDQMLSKDVRALWEKARARRARMDHTGAAELLGVARTLSPDSTMILLELMQVLVEAGFPIRAAELLGEPALQEQNLVYHQQLLLQAAIERMSGNHAAAADSMQALVALYPAHEMFAHSLFQDLLNAGFTDRAERVLNGIWTRFGGAENDARYWLASFSLSWRKFSISDAIADVELALETAGRVNSKSLEANAMLSMARIQSYLGKTTKSLEWVERARTHFMMLNNQQGLMRSWYLQGTTLLAANETDAAEQATEQACKIQRNTLSHDGWSDCMYLRGLLSLARLDLQQARHYLTEATTSAGYSLNSHLSGQIQLALGQASLISNEPSSALEHFRNAELRFRHADCRRGLAYARLGSGSSLLQAGNPGLASPIIQEALEMFRANEDHPGIEKAVDELALALGEGKDESRAVTLYHSIYGHQSSI